MDPAILLPGSLGGPVGPYVRSPALYDLRARDFALLARTGQVITQTRAGWAYARDAQSNFALAMHSQPAWEALDLDADGVKEELGILLELQRTNVLTSPFPGVQTVSLAAGTYTLQVWGSGTVALSGGPAGTASEGNPMTFTLGATTSVTFTLTGSAQAVQCELGTFGTSPAAGTRFISYLASSYLAPPQAGLHYCRFQDRGTSQISGARVWEIGAAGNRLLVYATGGTLRYTALCETGLGSVSSAMTSTPAYGAPVELLLVQLKSGAVRLVQSIAEVAVTSGLTSGALAFPTGGAYGAQTMRINADGAGGNVGAMAFLERRSLPWLDDFAGMSDQQLMDFVRAS